MNYSSAGGSSVHTTVNLIMSAKPLDTIVGQPNTEAMDWMTEQMAQMVAPVKTSTVWVTQPPAVHPDINDQTSGWVLLRLQAMPKQLQKEFDPQEAVTNIGIQRIIDSVEE